MSNQRSNIEMISRERENIFDDYYNLIEIKKLDNLRNQIDSGMPDYESLIKSLTILERNIDDLASVKNLGERKFTIINDLLISCLKDWLKIFELLIGEPKFINAFSYNILALAVLLSQSNKLELLDFNKDIIYLSPSRKDKSDYYKAVDIYPENSDTNTELQRLFYAVSSNLNYILKSKSITKKEIIRRLDRINSDYRYKAEFGLNLEFSLILAKQINTNFEIKRFPFIDFLLLNEIDSQDIESYREKINMNDIHSIIENIRNNEDVTYEWDLEVTIKGEIFNAAQIGFLMWSLSKTLESIDGVSVVLQDWGNGSKRFNLKIWIRDFLAKEEVKQVLDKGRKAAEAKYLDTPIEEAGKLKAEKEKTIKETENLRSKEETMRMHELEMQEKEIELMNKAADLALKKMQVIRGFSELIKDGILKNDSDFEIMINSLLFVQKKEGKIYIGEDISLIEEKEIKNSMSEDDETKLTDQKQK